MENNSTEKTTEEAQSRDRANGQYAPTGENNLCKCGHILGAHSADRRTVDGVRFQPCFVDELFPGAAPCDCECYKKARGVEVTASLAGASLDMNTTTKCGNGCKHHCSLCDRHGMNKSAVPQGWLRVARGRFVCDDCQYMARMSESDPEYVTRIAKMGAEARARFVAWLNARGGVA